MVATVLYFKHNELASRFRVSLKTVHNWIDAAKEGKVNLQLHEHDGKTYIANTSGNFIALQYLAEKGKKYRNSLHQKVISPSEKFYSLYSQRQTLDLITNLTTHHEIPRQYNYFDGGATNWDNWLKRLEKEESSNLLKGTLELIHNNIHNLDLLLKDYKYVNVIDIGVGNGRPVKEVLSRLLKQKKLHRYIAIDISRSMLDIAKSNIEKWFGKDVKFEGYIKDISFERFDDLLVEDMLSEKADKTINLVLVLGATPVNFRIFSDPLKVVYGSMSDRDILVYTDKPDTESSRRYFDFNPKPGAGELSPNHRFILDLMNIDSSLYNVEMGFDEQKRMRFVRIRLKAALSIHFKVNDGERIVELEKGDTIMLLRVWHLSAVEVISEFEKQGFTLLHSNLTPNRQFLLTISGVDPKHS